MSKKLYIWLPLYDLNRIFYHSVDSGTFYHSGKRWNASLGKYTFSIEAIIVSKQTNKLNFEILVKNALKSLKQRLYVNKYMQIPHSLKLFVSKMLKLSIGSDIAEQIGYKNLTWKLNQAKIGRCTFCVFSQEVLIVSLSKKNIASCSFKN